VSHPLGRTRGEVPLQQKSHQVAIPGQELGRRGESGKPKQGMPGVTDIRGGRALCLSRGCRFGS